MKPAKHYQEILRTRSLENIADCILQNIETALDEKVSSDSLKDSHYVIIVDYVIFDCNIFDIVCDKLTELGYHFIWNQIGSDSRILTITITID